MHFWHWYTTISASPYWLQHQDNALIAIASVSAVAWTGGLIAWQLKQYSYQRNFALDLLQGAFMAPVLALFMQPLTFRYVATLFFGLFLWQYARLFYHNRNVDATKATAGASKYPAVNDQAWEKISIDSRSSALIGIMFLSFYAAGIVWPYPRAIAWISAGLLFFGYQLVVYVLNSTPDRQTTDSLAFHQVVVAQISAVSAKADVIVDGLKMLIRKP